jgi:hypothetical protein
MDEKILKAAQAELQRHTWGTFVDQGVSVALGWEWHRGFQVVKLAASALIPTVNT